MTNKELLPCPFCGGKGVPDTVEALRETHHFIRCLSCACEGPWARSASGSAYWWNMRVPAVPIEVEGDGG